MAHRTLQEDFRAGILKIPLAALGFSTLVMGTDFVSILDTDPRDLSLESPLWAKTWQVFQALRPLED